MRYIPKSTNIRMQFYKGITVPDLILGFILLIVVALIATSNLPLKFIIVITTTIIVITMFFSVGEEKIYMSAVYMFKHIFSRKVYQNLEVEAIFPHENIEENSVTNKDGTKFGVIEIKPMEFRLLSEVKQNYLIDGILSNVINCICDSQELSIVKLEKKLNLDEQIQSELSRIKDLIRNHENGILTEEEYKARLNIVEDRITVIDELNSNQNITYSGYYFVLYDKEVKSLQNSLSYLNQLLNSGGIEANILSNEELYDFIYQSINNGISANEVTNNDISDTEIYKTSISKLLPKDVNFGYLQTKQDDKSLSHFIITDYPLKVGNAWGEELFDIPNTKVVMKLKPVEKSKALRRIDNTILEVSSQNKGKASTIIDKSTHAETLSSLLVSLQNNNEMLFDVTVIITAFDEVGKNIVKKTVKRKLKELGLRFNEMGGRQLDTYMASGLSTYDKVNISRGIQSSSIAAAFPFVSNAIIDKNGLMLGENILPVFVDFFKRDSDHVNSNMVIIGKSGSGKSYAVKTLLAHLASTDSKIFILDPDGEYPKLTLNLGGKVLDVASSKYGKLNPFQVITSLDDENEDGTNNGFFQHLQFLEEFFRLILDGINSDCLELVNKKVLELYVNKGITGESDFTKLKPEDYPTFDNLATLVEEQLSSETDEYTKSCLKILINYLSKFKSGGRNSALWNGASLFNATENVVCFDFKKLLANKNGKIANAQMLLVLKWLENEVIKNREYNLKNGTNRKIIVVIDEAHLFFDDKCIALDFMYQLAKRIRKYSGMQITITQNVKDFAGTPETARKSMAIINVSQYSMIFSLSPNDISDLCALYEKAGKINEAESDNIIYNPCGQAFLMSSPSSRTNIKIVATQYIESLFKEG